MAGRAEAANEVPGLTGLRGIAALAVCLMHLGNSFPRLGIAAVPLVDRSWLAVELFLLMSGFIVAHVYGTSFARGVTRAGWADFVVSRFARIWPLASAALLLSILLHLLAGGEPDLPLAGPRSAASALQSLLLVNGFFAGGRWNYPSWSITAEMLNYLLAPFLVLAVSRASWPALALIAAGCLLPVALVNLTEAALARDDGRLLFTFAGHWLMLQGPARPFLDFTSGLPIIGRCLPLFILGAIIARLRREGRLRPFRHDAVAALAALLVLASIQLTTVSTLTVLAFVLLLASVTGGGGRRVLESAPLRWLGEVSFGVYMVHAPLQLALYDLLDRLGIDHAELDWQHGLPLLLLLLLLVAVTAHLGWLLVERPARRAIRAAWAGRRHASAPPLPVPA